MVHEGLSWESTTENDTEESCPMAILSIESVMN